MAEPPRVLQPNVLVAIDVALFSVRMDVPVGDAWQVLLIRRAAKAFHGRWALPGVLIRPQETFEAAAHRALRAKTNLDAHAWFLDQVGVFGDPGRDPDGRVISVLHLAFVKSNDLLPAAGEGVSEVAWHPVRRMVRKPLAFDHGELLQLAVRRAQSKLRYSCAAFQLLPETFTVGELKGVYAAILDPSLEAQTTSNFKKPFAPLLQTRALIEVGRRPGKTRPPDLFRFQGSLADTWERELVWEGKL